MNIAPSSDALCSANIAPKIYWNMKRVGKAVTTSSQDCILRHTKPFAEAKHPHTARMTCLSWQCPPKKEQRPWFVQPPSATAAQELQSLVNLRFLRWTAAVRGAAFDSQEDPEVLNSCIRKLGRLYSETTGSQLPTYISLLLPAPPLHPRQHINCPRKYPPKCIVLQNTSEYDEHSFWIRRQ